MNGPEVFKLAVRHMGEVASTLLERNRLRPQDIGCFIAHQANLRIVESTAKRLGLRPNQVYNNIQRYGNTTSATIPTCLFEAEAEGKIRRGDWVICVTFGAGLTWGGFLMRWGARPLPKVEDVKIPDTTTESYPDRLRPGRDWQQR
jgi:3-oxoacyl-[acyl-carrier-protein] synthase-3